MSCARNLKAQKQFLANYSTKCKFARRFQGLKLKHFFWNFEQKYKTWQRFRPSTQNYFWVFKFRAQGISICWKNHSPRVFENSNYKTFLFILHYKYSTKPHKPKTLYPEPFCEVENDLKSVQFFLYTLYSTEQPQLKLFFK